MISKPNENMWQNAGQGIEMKPINWSLLYKREFFQDGFLEFSVPIQHQIRS